MGRYYRRRHRHKMRLTKKDMKILGLLFFWPLVLMALVIKAIVSLRNSSKNKKPYPKKGTSSFSGTPYSENRTFAEYSVKKSIMTECEKHFFKVIKDVVGADYIVQPQINLASVIEKNSSARYRNELFRNVDFGVFDHAYKPLVLIEINDSTHESSDRKSRDRKVYQLCQMANIPLITFWTWAGIHREYIEKRLGEYLYLEKADEEPSSSFANVSKNP